jgi:hypothetical protein
MTNTANTNTRITLPFFDIGIFLPPFECSIAPHWKICAKQQDPTVEVRLGNRLPTLGKLVQIIGIVLLCLVGLSGSKNILGKKCAQLSIRKTTIFI